MDTIEERLSQVLGKRELAALEKAPVLKCHRCGHDWARRPVRVNGQLMLGKLPERCPECNAPGWAYAHIKPPHVLTHNGKTATVSEWARKFDVGRSTLVWRLKNGWTVERALKTEDGRYSKK